MALTYQEADAPTWLWLNVLLALALLRAAPEGRLRRWAQVYRALALVVLLCAFVPFALTQLRLAVYPQLDVGAPAAPLSADYGLGAVVGRCDAGHASAAAGSPGLCCPRAREIRQCSNIRRPPRQVFSGAPSTAGDRGYRCAPQPGDRRGARRHRAGRARPAAVALSRVRLLLERTGGGRCHRALRDQPAVADAAVAARRHRALGAAAARADAEPRCRSLPQWLRSRLPARLAVLLVACVLGMSAQCHGCKRPRHRILRCSASCRRRLLAPPKCAPQCAEITSAEVSVAARADAC